MTSRLGIPSGRNLMICDPLARENDRRCRRIGRPIVIMAMVLLSLAIVVLPLLEPLSAAGKTRRTPTVGFYGAARTISGSCHILDTGYERIMLDCGTFMERGLERRNNYFHFDPASVDLLLLSHAHIDHNGRIPLLFNRGFSGTVLCVPPTKELSRIMLEIQVMIALETKRLPLYTNYDIQRAIANFHELPFNQAFTLPSGTVITPLNAQHILGAAMFLITFGPPGKRETLLYSGDFGNARNTILRAREDFPSIDYLIIESTYGGKVRDNYDTERDSFYSLIRDTIDDGGIMLIPSFVLARTQKVIGLIHRGMSEGKVPRNLHLYIDSSSASAITRIYAEYPEQMADEFRGPLHGGESPFDFPNLHLHKTFTIDDIQTPAVVIAPSSDISKGAITTYIANYIDRSTTRICFVSSYQEPGSLGDKLVKGATDIELNGRYLPVRAKIHVIASFSGHGDQRQILDWLARFPALKRVFVVHGSPAGTDSLAAAITKAFDWPTTVPLLNKTYDLGSGVLLRARPSKAAVTKPGPATGTVPADSFDSVFDTGTDDRFDDGFDTTPEPTPSSTFPPDFND